MTLFQNSWLRLQRPNKFQLFHPGWASIHAPKRLPLLWVHITFLLWLVKWLFMPSFSCLIPLDHKLSKSRGHISCLLLVSRVMVFNFYRAGCGRLYFPKRGVCVCVCHHYMWHWHSFKECQSLTPERCVCVYSYPPTILNLSKNLKLPQSVAFSRS